MFREVEIKNITLIHLNAAYGINNNTACGIKDIMYAIPLLGIFYASKLKYNWRICKKCQEKLH